MNHTYRIIPVYTGDVSGVCSALYELGGMVVIHDPSGCNSTYNTHDETRWYDTDSMIYISGLAERDAILGNDDKFLRDVTAAAEELLPSFIALTNSPIPFMNGTDFEALAKIIEKRTHIPTFYVRANGMHDYTVGAGNALAKLADYMGQKQEEKAVQEIRVNILGLTPLDFDAPGSAEILTDLLKSHGFSIHVCLGMGENHSDWQSAPQADVNLVISSTGTALAQKMETLYGIPYVIGMPTGAFIGPLFEQLEHAALSKKSVVAYKELDGIGKCQNTTEDTLQCREEQSGIKKSTGKLVMIGEAVTTESLAAALDIQYGIQTHVICPLETWQGLLRDCDYHTEGEEELEQLLHALADEKESGQRKPSQGQMNVGVSNLWIAADPLYRPILPVDSHFIPLSHEAFSGRCFKRDRKCLVGEHAEVLSVIAEVLSNAGTK
jgi:hypothetical protein